LREFQAKFQNELLQKELTIKELNLEIEKKLKLDKTLSEKMIF